MTRPDPYAWAAHPDALLGIAGLVLIYALAARCYAPGRRRAVFFGGGCALLVATAVTPLDALSFHLLSAHLLQNVVLAEWAPALLVLGVAPALAVRLTRSKAVQFVTRPPMALGLWLGLYFAWHLPPAYDAALRHPATLLHLEHASYVAAGAIFWWPLLQAAPHALSNAARALYLFAAFVLASPIGLLLALVPRAAYGYYVEGGGLWGLSPHADQQLAGVTMAVEQSIVFFAVFAVFVFRFFAEEESDGSQRAAR
ncbi:MAG: cytochrome c oxidase assembly protein [Actinobacteria bacterium]|nr:cytochrome c oxidase assembly protein [Actinomycetota bacterium]